MHLRGGQLLQRAALVLKLDLEVEGALGGEVQRAEEDLNVEKSGRVEFHKEITVFLGDVGRLVQLEQVSGRLLAVAADVVGGAVAVSEAGWVVIASALVETGAGVGLDAAEGVCGDRAEDQGEQKGCYQHLVTNYKI